MDVFTYALLEMIWIPRSTSDPSTTRASARVVPLSISESAKYRR